MTVIHPFLTLSARCHHSVDDLSSFVGKFIAVLYGTHVTLHFVCEDRWHIREQTMSEIQALAIAEH